MITKAASVEINLRDCTLICDCNDAETDLAIKAFKAQIQREGELLKIQ